MLEGSESRCTDRAACSDRGMKRGVLILVAVACIFFLYRGESVWLAEPKIGKPPKSSGPAVPRVADPIARSLNGSTQKSPSVERARLQFHPPIPSWAPLGAIPGTHVYAADDFPRG